MPTWWNRRQLAKSYSYKVRAAQKAAPINYQDLEVQRLQELKELAERGYFSLIVYYNDRRDVVDNTKIDVMIDFNSGLGQIDQAISLAQAGNRIQAKFGVRYGNYRDVTVAELEYMRQCWVNTYGDFNSYKDWEYQEKLNI